MKKSAVSYTLSFSVLVASAACKRTPHQAETRSDTDSHKPFSLDSGNPHWFGLFEASSPLASEEGTNPESLTFKHAQALKPVGWDHYGGRYVRVRGAAKVTNHLMFGVLVLTAVRLAMLST